VLYVFVCKYCVVDDKNKSTYDGRRVVGTILSGYLILNVYGIFGTVRGNCWTIILLCLSHRFSSSVSHTFFLCNSCLVYATFVANKQIRFHFSVAFFHSIESYTFLIPVVENCTMYVYKHLFLTVVHVHYGPGPVSCCLSLWLTGQLCSKNTLPYPLGQMFYCLVFRS